MVIVGSKKAPTKAFRKERNKKLWMHLTPLVNNNLKMKRVEFLPKMPHRAKTKKELLNEQPNFWDSDLVRIKAGPLKASPLAKSKRLLMLPMQLANKTSKMRKQGLQLGVPLVKIKKDLLKGQRVLSVEPPQLPLDTWALADTMPVKVINSC